MSVSGIHHVTLLVDDEEKASHFYGQVLGLEQKPRPAFRFPGLFYRCGNQEIHLIIASRPLIREDLYIQIDGASDITRPYIHRHAALVVSDLPRLLDKLTENAVELLLDPRSLHEKRSDPLLTNLIEGWNRMYGTAPVFCLDPFGNLLEIVPESRKSD
jgi:catechol 2,3-dioxygenase-like lactoylglutathione lyase family enzyme